MMEKWKWKQERFLKRGEDFFFFFFFFFFLLFTFENDGNLFWVYQNGNFLPGKSISRREKNLEKRICPLRKICLLHPWVFQAFTGQTIVRDAWSRVAKTV